MKIGSLVAVIVLYEALLTERSDCFSSRCFYIMIKATTVTILVRHSVGGKRFRNS